MKRHNVTAIAIVGLAGIASLLSGCGEKSVAVSDELFTVTDTLLTLPNEPFLAEKILVSQCLQSNDFEAPTNFSVNTVSGSIADIPGIIRTEGIAKEVGYNSTIDYSSEDKAWSNFESSLSRQQMSKYKKLTEFDPNITDKERDRTCYGQAAIIIYGSFSRKVEIVNTFNEYSENKQSSTRINITTTPLYRRR